MLLSISVFLFVRHGLYQEADDSVRETASILANQMEYEHGEIIFEWEEGIGTNGDISDQSLFQYWYVKDGTTTRSPALRGDDLPRFTGPGGKPVIETVSIPGRLAHARALGMTIYPYVLPDEKLRMRADGVTFDPMLHPHTLVVARDLSPALRILAKLASILAIGTVVTLGIGILLVSRAIGVSLAPIGVLTREVRARSGNSLDAAIVLPGNFPSELSPLAEGFNELLFRVATIRDREKDFIRHAAHELRTPIASLSATTELALSKERGSAEYVRFLETCARTSSDLSLLVQRLSALSRIGKPGEAPAITPISLGEILEKSLIVFSSRFATGAIDVSTDLPEGDCLTMADPVLTTLVINNLLDNAASYAPPRSGLTIRFSRNGDRDELSFTNSASDLPENLDRLFEPLFRKDKSRTEMSRSHLGIGLTLSREAAQGMRGTLTAYRPDGRSVRFTLSLPAG